MLHFTGPVGTSDTRRVAPVPGPSALAAPSMQRGVCTPPRSPQVMKTKSTAAAFLCNWVVNIVPRRGAPPWAVDSARWDKGDDRQWPR